MRSKVAILRQHWPSLLPALSPPASAQGLGWGECLRAGLSPDSETAVQQDGSEGCALPLTATPWTHTTWPRQPLTPGHQAGMAHQPAPTPVYQPAFFVALGPALGSGEGRGGSACRASTTEPSMGCHISFHCVPAFRQCHTGLVTAGEVHTIRHIL